jgi:hypothetical protein
VLIRFEGRLASVEPFVKIMYTMKFRLESAVWRSLNSFSRAFRFPMLVMGLTFLLATIAPAAPFASETFESYSPGSLSSQTGGGTGWTGNWTAPGNVTRAEVVDTTGNPLSFTSAGGALINGASRALEVQLSGTAASQLAGVRTLATPVAQTFYAGYLVRHHAGVAWAGANNTFTLHLGTNSSSTATLNFGIRGDTSPANEFIIRYGTSAPVGGASTGGQIVTGTNYYLVARVNYSGGAFTSANLWLNPAADDDTATPNGDASLSGFSFANPISHVFFRQAVLDADDVLRADEIRIGTAWSDVVPSGGPTNPPPSVSLTNPVNNASFLAPANILLEATAADSNGTVTNVAFYVGTTKLADDATEPFEYNWTSVAAASYALTAVATDNLGASTTSAVVNVTVTLPSMLIAEDSFYTGGGTLNGRSGGSGWAGAWVTNGLGNLATCVDSTGGSLQFTPDGGATILGGSEAVDITGTLNQPVVYRQLASAQNGTFYVAYLLRQVAGSWGGNNTLSLHLADSGASTSSLNFGMRGGADFMVRNGTGAPGSTNAFGGSLAFDTTCYLVARFSKPPGSTRYDRIEMWRNPGLASSNAPNTTLTLPANTGLASITHLFFRAAALDADDVVRVDELKVGATWQDVLAPWIGTPAVDSFTLMYPGTGGPVPGYDPITNNATINLFLAGTNLSLRANSSPTFDFGSVAFSLTGPTAQSQTDNSYPWSLFGEAGGSYTGANFSVGAHSLTGTPYPADAASGVAGIPASINFSVVNTIVISNRPPTITLTNPANAATFTAPTTVLLQATASDTDGTVTNVAFYQGTTKLGEASGVPYSFFWTNVSAGAYTLTARATDNEGAVTISSPVTISVLSTNTSGTVSGELKKWHKVMVTWTGPNTSETNANNPFRNYRLNVTFTHPISGKSHLVPGYWAADGNAANTSAQSGDQWRVNFAPDEVGTWNFVASFRAGTDVALDASPTAGAPSHFDGAGGSFVIGPTDKTGRDHRGKGRLQYVGKHHLRFAETGEFFLKMGADSPENLLNYVDFDDQPPGAQYLKTWSLHAGDYDPADASAYTWKGGKGTNLMGAIKYLSDKGMNAFSFIPFTVPGDDKNVCPHLLKGTSANPSWSTGVHQDRFDVSRMEQWERIFAYGDQQGMYLHFKTLENESQLTMDGGNLGPTRKLYYRELIARYGHHLALNWNLGEEVTTATTAQKVSWSQYFYDHDPFHHNMVIHNMNVPHYDMLGTTSKLTGFSMQKSGGTAATLDYLSRSDAAGVPWVVALDESGGADQGVPPDSVEPSHDSRRGGIIWGHVLGGGAGQETYFGYAVADSGDLTSQNFRRYDIWWDQCRYALEFYKSNSIPFWNMTNRNSLFTGGGTTYCFATNGQVYVGYMSASGTGSLNLSGVSGTFTVRWFDPYNGGGLQTGSVAQVTGGGTRSLGTAPVSITKDRVVLVKLVPPPDTTPPGVSITAPTNGASLFANLPVQVSATVTDNVAVAQVELWVDGSLWPLALTNGPYNFSVTGLALGGHKVAVVGQDTAANRATNSLGLTLIAPGAPALNWSSIGGGWQLQWTAPGFVLEQTLKFAGPWTNLAPITMSPLVISTTNPETYYRLRWTSP